VSHTATLSHKQELTNQRSPHFYVTLAILLRDKVERGLCTYDLINVISDPFKGIGVTTNTSLKTACKRNKKAQRAIFREK